MDLPDQTIVQQTVTSQPVLCLALSQGFSVRYMLQTDILPRLLEQGARVVALVPQSEVEHVRALVPPEVIVEAAPARPRQGWWERHLFALRSYLHAGHVANLYEVYRRELRARPRTIHRITLKLLFALARLLAVSRLTRRSISALEALFYGGHEFDDFLDRHRPSLVVVNSAGAFGFDAGIHRAARRKCIASATVVLSWDNITSKPYPAVFGDYVIAWTERMKRDLAKHIDYHPEQVAVCGIAHFDVYSRPDKHFDRAAVLRGLGLDPAKRTIVFITKSPNAYPWNPNLAEALAREISIGALENAQLVIRIHPIHYRRRPDGMPVYEAINRAYAALRERYANVALSEPRVVQGSVAVAMEQDEMRELSRLLRAADVIVNLFSTVNIEGALLDKPLVNACFEGDSTLYPVALKSRFNIRSDALEDHNMRIVDSGGVAMVYSPQQMIEQVALYLADPAIDRAGRQAIVANEGGPYRGRAGAAIADRLLFLGSGPVWR